MKEAVMLINNVPITLLGQRKDKVFVYICLDWIHIQVNLDMTDSMGPGKLVRHMQNPAYTYDGYLICIELGPSISSVICNNPSYSGPSYPSSPVLSYSSISQGSSRKKCLGMLSGVQHLALGLSYFLCIYLSSTLGSDLMEIKDIPIKKLEKRTVSSQKPLYLSDFHRGSLVR